MLKGRRLYTNLFSPKEYEKTNKIILKGLRWKKIFCVAYSKYRKFKTPNVSYTFEKKLVLSITCSKWGNEDKKIFKEQESIGILKILVWLKIYNYFKNMAEENIRQ